MLTLTIGNSYSQLTGLSALQEKQVRSALSYTVGDFFSGFGPRKKSMINKKGFFPTGLLHRLPLIPGKTIDNRKVPKQAEKPFLQPSYLWQDKAVQKATIYHRGGIVAPTGSGKSRAMLMMCIRFDLKTLIIVPSLEIKKQLSEDMKQCPKVVVENIDSPRLKTLTDFDMLIIDEVHGAAAKTYQTLNKTAWTKIYYRYFFSATYFRNSPDETMLFEAVAGKPIYQLTYKEAVTAKYIVPIESYYLDIPKQEVQGFTYREVYNEAVVNNVVRNIIIGHAIYQLTEAGRPLLCLVKEVAHGKILANLTGVSFVHGQDDESRKYIQKFKDGKINSIIATTAMLGEGIDTKPCEFVIIAGSGKAKSQFMQQVGRTLRNFPGKESGKVILVKDRSHRYLTKHYGIQRKILLEEYACIPTKLEV